MSSHSEPSAGPDYSRSAAYPVIQRLLGGELDAQLSESSRARHREVRALAESLPDEAQRRLLLGSLSHHIHRELAYERASEQNKQMTDMLKRERPVEHSVLRFVALVQAQAAAAKSDLARVRKEMEADGTPGGGRLFWLEHEHHARVAGLRSSMDQLMADLRGAAPEVEPEAD